MIVMKTTDADILCRWQKIGRIFVPAADVWWMKSHAMLPSILHLAQDRCRVFFSGRDDKNRSHIGYFDLDLQNPAKILSVSPEPVLAPGELGCFDDSGVTPSCLVREGEKVYLYYIGWSQRSSVRMGLVAGLAVSGDGGQTFKRYSRAPLLERTDHEPFAIMTAPYVLKDRGIWKLWYVSGIGWQNPDLPRYNIKYAQSADGIHWQRDGHVCIELNESENALARPCVLKEDGIYKMWYAYKGADYRIGYAESADGLMWTRKDQDAGIEVSPSGWDSQMIEYAYVLNHQGKKYMFYNGNDYGKEGIGLAVLGGRS